MAEKKKPLEYKWILFLAQRLGYFLNNTLCHSVRWKKVGYENLQALKEDGGLLFLWHETIMASIFTNKFEDIWTISSTHRDSMVQEYILRKYQVHFVKGSSKHNGAKALLGVINGLRENKIFAITCDGPSGPPYVCKPGAVSMLRKTGKGYVCIGVALKDKWIFERSWDHHQIPKFFTKGVISYSEIKHIDENMSDEDILRQIEQDINEQKEKAHKILES